MSLFEAKRSYTGLRSQTGRFRPTGRADFLCSPKENRRKETAPDHVARRPPGGGCPVRLAVGRRCRRAVLARLQRLRHPCLARRCAPTYPPPAAMLGHVTRVRVHVTPDHGLFRACAQPRRAVGDGSAGRLFEPKGRVSDPPVDGEHRRGVAAPQARRPEQWHPPFSAPFGRAKGARPSGRKNVAIQYLPTVTCNQRRSVRH